LFYVFMIYLTILFVAQTMQYRMARLLTNTDRKIWKKSYPPKPQSGYVVCRLDPRTFQIWSRCGNYSTATLYLPIKCKSDSTQHYRPVTCNMASRWIRLIKLASRLQEAVPLHEWLTTQAMHIYHTALKCVHATTVAVKKH
jgi:hypothetical protein